MTALCRTLPAVLIAVLIAATASAAVTVALNGDDPGVFDQPSAVQDGNTVHVAYIGADSEAGPFRVWYAAVNGGADFNNATLTRDDFLVTHPTPVIDNVGSVLLDNVYFDARHPKIARRTANEFVIFFQAKPDAADNVYRLYRALVTINNKQVVSQSVREVSGATSGDIQDVSFGLVSADNTARVVYASRPSPDPGVLFQVYYAKVDLESAAVIGNLGNPVPLSDSAPGSDGFRPVPSLKLDGLNRAHVAWASRNNTVSAGAIFYALVKETGGESHAAIAATQVLGLAKSWDHPSVLVSANNSIIVLAAVASDPEQAGEVGAVELNPDAVPHDNTSVDALKLVVHEKILDQAADLYRPEAFLDGTMRIHLTGYGIDNTAGTYYVVNRDSLFTTLEFVQERKSFGSDEPPGDIDGDYTKAAFAFLSGKTVIFWSGQAASGNRNLDVTAVPSVIESEDESGCAIVRNPERGASRRIPGSLLIVLPVIVLGIRRLVRRRLGF